MSVNKPMAALVAVGGAALGFLVELAEMLVLSRMGHLVVNLHVLMVVDTVWAVAVMSLVATTLFVAVVLSVLPPLVKYVVSKPAPVGVGMSSTALVQTSPPALQQP